MEHLIAIAAAFLLLLVMLGALMLGAHAFIKFLFPGLGEK